KANLRRGVVVKPWVYETLAIALRADNASEEEIERAETSLADLEPQDAEGFLKASKAMADHKRWDRALAFCRQAALLEPGAPKVYADALNSAEMAKDVGAMEWAAGNLLKQDWPVKGDELHRKAQDRVEALTKALEASPGKYQITVDKVWGRPLGDKAQLTIIQHQGTDKETSKLITVNLAEKNTVEIDLAEGRRTEVATVPPASLQPSTEPLGEDLGA